MNTTERFFMQFHRGLAYRYSLTESQVHTIRAMTLHEGFTRRQLAEWCILKYHGIRKNRHHDKAHYGGILNFLASCSPTDYEEIIQKTSFDRASQSHI